MSEVDDPESLDAAYRGRRVLVTGGAGFIGSHLVNSLVGAGADVTVVDNLATGSRESLSGSPPARWIEADLRDADRLVAVVRNPAPEFVFHLAANANVPASVQNPRYDFELNCLTTICLLDALRIVGSMAAVVHASSAAVYGEPKQFPITEGSPVEPISPYGASKLASEVVAEMFHRVYSQRVMIARLFNVFGPRMPRFVVKDFLRKLEEDPEHLEILGDGRQVRDFTYVLDTVQGLMVIGLRGQPGETYNVASGVSHSVTDLAQHLLDLLGLKGRTRISYSGESWVGDAQRWEVDVRKLRALGYTPRFDLDAGLRAVIDGA